MARPRQTSDEEILDAARSCFLEHGPSVSTATIAAKLGVSQAALFKRFGTKKELMLSALLPGSPEWLTAVERGPDPDREIPSQLLDIARAAAAYFARLTPCMATLRASKIDFREAMARYDVPPPLRARAAMTAWFTAAQEQCRMGPVHPEEAALLFLGSMHMRCFLGHMTQTAQPSDPARLERMVDALWSGLTPPLETP